MAAWLFGAFGRNALGFRVRYRTGEEHRKCRAVVEAPAWRGMAAGMRFVPGTFTRQPRARPRRPVARAAAAGLLLLSLFGAPGLPSPALAQGTAELYAKESAERLADTLIRNLNVGSTVVVRPLTGGHTGLPDSVAKRMETLVVGTLDAAIPANMDVNLITGDDVHRIYGTLEASSFGADAEKLLASVLRAARGDTVLACEPTSANPESFELRCSVTSGRVACADGGTNLRSCEGTIEVQEVRSLAAAQAIFPWGNPREHLNHVFTGLAWEIVRKAGLNRADEVRVEGQGSSTESDTELGEFVKRSLRREMAVAKKRSLGWSGVAGEGRNFRLGWHIAPWDSDSYELSVELYEEATGGASYVTGGNASIVISSLPSNMRLSDAEVVEIPPDDEDDPSPPPPPPKVRVKLPDGLSVSPGDWALLREESLESGKYKRVFVEAKAHIEKHGLLEPFVRVRDRAAAGLVGQFRIETKAEAERELPRIKDIEGSVGDWPELLLIKARAHRLLGDYSSEMNSYKQWLDADTGEHPDRRPVLIAYRHAVYMDEQGVKFSDALGRAYSAQARDESTGWTDLHHAALLNNSGVVLALVEAGMEPDVRLGKDAPFGEALKRTLRDLGHGDEFEHWSADGETPLMIAALANKAEAAEELLERGAEHDARNERGSTPLHFAALHDASAVAKLLLDRGAGANAKDRDEMAPLHNAATVDAHAVAGLLLARGADANAKSWHGKTPLHHAAWYGAGETARLLVEGGAELDAREDDGDTSLHSAASAGELEVVELLLGHRAKIDARNKHGRTPLHEAARRNAGETARMLLERGAVVMARATDGSTPLHHAAWGDAEGIASLLLARGAEIDAKDERGRTPLHWAAWKAAGETARMLVKRGADTTARADDGSAVLHFAAQGDATGIAELLLARGVDAVSKDERGRTPLEVAAEAGSRKAEALLDRHLDDAAYAEAKRHDTAASYREYLAAYPKGIHSAEARERRAAAKLRDEDRAAFAEAKRLDTVASYSAYLRSFSGGLHASEARALQAAARVREEDNAAYAEAKRHDTAASYREYLAAYPQGIHAAEARERRAAAKLRDEDRAAYAEAKRLDTVASYSAYLRSYPGGLHASGARTLRARAKDRDEDRAAFTDAKRKDTSAGFDRYLESRTRGRHVVEARRLRAAAFRREDAAAFSRVGALDTVRAYVRYLESYPEGNFRDEARRLRAAAQQREDDRAAYAEAKRRDTVAAYDAYLESYPQGRHAGEARGLRAAASRRAEDAAFARAKRLDTVAGYDRYLELHSRGRHAAEARRLRAAAKQREDDRAAFAEAKRRDTVAAYNEYLASHPRGLHAVEARGLRAAALRKADDAEFAGAKRKDMVPAYDGYLGSYPQGRHVVEARRLRAAAAFREADAAAFSRANDLDTVAAYDAYLQSYPEGSFRGRASRLRAAAAHRDADHAAFAEAKRRDTVAAYDEYLASYPQGRHAVEARGLRAVALRKAEDAEFAEAKRKDTVPAYDGYLGSYPQGRHVAEARRLRAAASRVRKIGQVFRDCDDCPELVVVPPGTYVMGSPPSEEGRDEDEGPRHRVVLAEAIAIGTAEVTRGEYARFVRDTGHSEDDSCRTYENRKWKKRFGRDWRHPGYHQTDGHPVVCVNWDDAQRYVAWLSLKTGEDYRLPSEAEWEYAARAGTETSRHWGQDPRSQCRHANGADGAFRARHGDRMEDLAACDDGHAHTSPATRLGKNGFNLFDVLGNVWEWTADCGNPDYDEAPGDSRDWARGNCSLRVLRGGSWFSEPDSLRSANRLLSLTRRRNANVGFRVVRALPLAPPARSGPAAAIAAAEDEVFTRATTRNSVVSYDEYLALYPTGRHAERARNLRERAFRLLAAGGAFRDCPDCPEMVVVPAGSFELGSTEGESGRRANEGPSRQITLGESFAIGIHEVTRSAYAAFIGESGYGGSGACWVYEQGDWAERSDRRWQDPGYGQNGDHPAVCVSWTDATAYAGWLTRKTGIVYRLPSEAEWEYAARGGTRTARHFGDDASRQCQYANGADETANRQGAGLVPAASCRDGYLETAPVGRYEANGFGLHDVLGNAWEWTRDCWNDGHGGASSDGRARERGDCARRVLRGGSWSSYPRFLRSAHRGTNPAGVRVNDVGFRVARALPWGADDGAFARAKGEGTAEAFEEYVRSYPEGRHVAEAKRLIAGPKPGETFRDCTACPRVVVVPSGRYRMGSPPDEEDRDRDEGRKEPVEIRAPLAVGIFEVTFDEWDACVAQGGCAGYRARDRGWGRGDRPVIFVSWRDARSYVDWLSRTTGKDYRLLTEAEWEFVARANRPARTRFTWGDAVGSGRANCESCGSRWDDRRTAPVGSFSANAFGVHDLHGNVAEWVEDCYESDYSKAPSDGTAFSRANCPKRVLRGGAWNDKPRYLRSANRSRSDPSTRAPGFGFRVVRSLP